MTLTRRVNELMDDQGMTWQEALQIAANEKPVDYFLTERAKHLTACCK